MSVVSGGTRREFLKQSGIAAVAVATGCTRDEPAPPASQSATPSQDEPFELQIELSGLWFLALTNGKLYALARQPKNPSDPSAHIPRLFVHERHVKQGGKPDTLDASYRGYDITKSIEWPQADVQVASEPAVLPGSVTDLATLTGHRFNETQLSAGDVYSIPLNFGEPDEEFSRTMFKKTRFKYQYKTTAGVSDCGDPWKPDKALAWRLTFYTWVTSPVLTLDYGDGPIEFTPRNSQLRLIFKNTTNEFSHPTKPITDNDSNAPHYVAHYDFLTPAVPAEKRCYPIRMEARQHDVSGLYTCMFGGGGS